jgi:hypothetical protein
LNESSDSVTIGDASSDLQAAVQRVTEAAYLSPVAADYETGKFKFAGHTMIDDAPLLFSVDFNKDTHKAKCTVQSENTVLNPLLLKLLKTAVVGDPY